MPKITNKYYKEFRETNLMQEEITTEQLQEWLDDIPNQNQPRNCSIAQARAIIILLFFTGRRPAELTDLKPKHLNKVTRGHRHYLLNIKTIKGGKQSLIHLPDNKLIKEAFDFMKKFPEEMYCFYAFRKPRINKVKITKLEKVIVQDLQPDGTVVENEVFRVAQKIKPYERKGALLTYYCTLWTGRPPYYFRHYRISEIFARDGTKEEALEFKGGISESSLQAYVHQSPAKSRRMVDLIKFKTNK